MAKQLFRDGTECRDSIPHGEERPVRVRFGPRRRSDSRGRVQGRDAAEQTIGHQWRKIDAG